MAEPSEAPSDEQLMAAYVAGDAAAFRLLFERYAGVLYGLSRRRLGNDDEARDIVQQTFLQLHRARHDFRASARLRPWLFTIALNLIRGTYRTRRRRREESLELAGRVPEAAVVDDAADAEQKARAARLRAALASIPSQQREVIELHWFEQSPYEEIARIVGASVAAVRVRAHRGYARLREILPDLL
jgi:RNA polymerase sigma factor (sigma-70 family)